MEDEKHPKKVIQIHEIETNGGKLGRKGESTKGRRGESPFVPSPLRAFNNKINRFICIKL
jgi:hypothetical protein